MTLRSLYSMAPSLKAVSLSTNKVHFVPSLRCEWCVKWKGHTVESKINYLSTLLGRKLLYFFHKLLFEVSRLSVLEKNIGNSPGYSGNHEH